LCDAKVRAQAEEYGHSEEREREYLIIHGLMHLFGYDHMTDEDKKQMREKEKAVLAILHEGEEQ
jgi:probable rRNA maturation factor